MAGGTLRVDIERTSRPVGRGPAAVTTGVRAGAAITAGRTTLRVEAGEDTHVGASIDVMDGSVMTGGTVRGHRTEAQGIMLGMSPFSVRSISA